MFLLNMDLFYRVNGKQLYMIIHFIQFKRETLAIFNKTIEFYFYFI